MTLKGKKLEAKIKDWLTGIPDKVHVTRLYDAMSMGRPNAPTVPADFALSVCGRFVFLECKEHQDTKSPFPLTNFRPSQLKCMREAVEHGNYKYYVVINNRLYDGNVIVRLILNDPKIKSLDRDFMDVYGYEFSTRTEFLEYLTNLVNCITIDEPYG